MALIAGVFATAHVLFPRDGVEDAADRVFEGIKDLGRRVREARPDVLVIATSDHLFNLTVNLQPPFVVGVADTFVPYGDMGVPKDPFPGHREFAEGFVRFASEVGFDLTRADDAVLRPDHGLSIPHLFIDRHGRIPTVPLLTNVTMDAPTSPKRSWNLGKALRRYILEQRPAGERVVVVAGGGLSHFIGGPEQGRINESFDRYVLDALAQGKGESLSDITGETLLREAGNGGLEICNWILAAAVAADSGGKPLFYEAIKPWWTGMGGFAFHEKAA